MHIQWSPWNKYIQRDLCNQGHLGSDFLHPDYRGGPYLRGYVPLIEITGHNEL